MDLRLDDAVGRTEGVREMNLSAFSCVFLLAAIPLMLDDAGVVTVLEPRRLHLGKPGQWEWDSFKNRAVDAERIEVKFQAKANTAENTLSIWQRDVKLAWPVMLNGRKLGRS
ncbi:MAG: hypothetical protein ABIP20_11230 [Chthoniobacteraceae bacterium]